MKYKKVVRLYSNSRGFQILQGDQPQQNVIAICNNLQYLHSITFANRQNICGSPHTNVNRLAIINVRYLIQLCLIRR